MGFNHMLVSKLLADTEKMIDRETTSQEEEERRLRITRTVDGVPNVALNVANFCEAIRSELRGIKFAYTRRGAKSVYNGGLLTHQTLWAYYPGDEFAVGMVGCADFAVSGTTDNKYCIYSRKITNDKFAEHRDQYFMVMSDAMERAVKNAKKHLRRYAVSEVADMTVSEFQSKLSTESWKAQSEFSDAKDAVFRHPSLTTELRSMIDRGYEFNCPLLRNAVTEYLSKHAEYEARKNAPTHGWFVTVRDEFGHQVFDTIEAYDIKGASRRTIGNWATKTLLPNELPEDLAHKLASLSMLNDDAYVEGLGMRVSASTYWVVR
jgi:hypothetical protein